MLKQYLLGFLLLVFTWGSSSSATYGQSTLLGPVKPIVPDSSFDFAYAIVSTSASSLRNATSLEDAIKQTEDGIVQLIATYGLPSLTFGLSIRGKTILSKSWGEADLENSVPAQPSTHYRLASISKSFTSLLIGTLVDQGKITNFQDSLWKYVSEADYPRKTIQGAQVDITVGELLANMAGTHVTQDSDRDLGLITGVNCTQMIGKFKDEPLLFRPGTNWVYSNYGFQLAGAIIESVTGQTYQEAMGEFFGKLGLNQTYVETTVLMVEDRARYFSFPNNVDLTENVPAPIFDALVFEEGWWAAGGLMSTVDDLLKYGQKYLDAYKGLPGAVISQGTLEQIWTKRTATLPNFPLRPINEYGYGFFIANITEAIIPGLKHREFIWHSGGLQGASTYLAIYPEEEAVGVVLVNKGSAPGLDSVVVNAMELIYDFADGDDLPSATDPPPGGAAYPTTPGSMISAISFLAIIVTFYMF